MGKLKACNLLIGDAFCIDNKVCRITEIDPPERVKHAGRVMFKTDNKYLPYKSFSLTKEVTFVV